MKDVKEFVAEQLEEELDLKHRIGRDITRVVVGGLFGSLAAWLYTRAVTEGEETEDEN